MWAENRSTRFFSFSFFRKLLGNEKQLKKKRFVGRVNYRKSSNVKDRSAIFHPTFRFDSQFLFATKFTTTNLSRSIGCKRVCGYLFTML